MNALKLTLTTLLLGSSLFATSANADFRVNQNQLTNDWQVELVQFNNWGDNRMKLNSSIATNGSQIGVTFALPFGK